MKTKLFRIEGSHREYLLLSPETNKLVFPAEDYDKLEMILFSYKTVGEAWDEALDGSWKVIMNQIVEKLKEIKKTIDQGCGLFVSWNAHSYINPEVELVRRLEEDFNCFELHALDLSDESRAFNTTIRTEVCEISDLFNPKRLIDQHIFDYCDLRIYNDEARTLTFLSSVYYQL